MVQLIVDIIALGLLYWVISLIPLPEPFPVIIKVLFILLAVLAILSVFGIHTGFPVLK